MLERHHVLPPLKISSHEGPILWRNFGGHLRSSSRPIANQENNFSWSTLEEQQGRINDLGSWRRLEIHVSPFIPHHGRRQLNDYDGLYLEWLKGLVRNDYNSTFENECSERGGGVMLHPTYEVVESMRFKCNQSDGYASPGRRANCMRPGFASCPIGHDNQCVPTHFACEAAEFPKLDMV